MSFGLGFSFPNWQTLSGGAFSPAQLFQGGVQGAWYDPSDSGPTGTGGVGTLFDDRAGTTPCAAPGAGAVVPVGAMLDKRASGYSVLFDGNGDWLSTPSNAVFDFGTGDFTIESWVYLTGYSANYFGNYAAAVISKDNNGNDTTRSWWINIGGTASSWTNFAYGQFTGNTFLSATGAFSFALNTWYHVAAVRSAGVVKLFVNGTQVGTDTTISTAPNTNSASVFIGQQGFSSYEYFFPGNISNLRIVKGTAVYTGNFTPPTAPLSPITGTSLLTCGTSWSGNPAITKNGDARVDGLNPFTASPVGNHAIAANDTTARPELSARVNLLTKTEQFEDAVWNKQRITVQQDTAVAPNGTTTADLQYLSASGNSCEIWRDVTVSSGVSYVMSVFAKASGKNFVALGINDGLSGVAFFNLATGAIGTVAAGLTASIRDANNGWYQCSVTFTASGASVQYTQMVTNADNSIAATANGTDGILVWGADLRPANIGTTIPAYQRVADQYTYDTVGFPRFLRAEGASRGMYTPSTINLGGNKVTAFAGVRKQSDAALGVIMESSATIASNNGAFLLSAPNSAAANYNFSSKGTTQVDNTVTTFTAPLSNVLSGQGDIGAPSNVIRVNGVATTVTSTQGTGNYGTYSLNLFGRNSQSGTPTAGTILNGDLYSVILVAGSTGQVAATEQWIAGKMSITI